MGIWDKVNLGDVCEVKKGTSITKDKVVPGSVPVIAGGQQAAYFHNTANRTGKTITISASGAYAGFVNYFEIPIFASDCTTVRPLSEEKLLTRYVYLFLKSRQQQIYLMQTGAGQPHVYARDLVKLKIPVPPLPVQRKIVSILEKAERIKQKRQLQIEASGKLAQSVFLEMFRNIELQNLDTKTIEIIDGDRGTNYPNGNDFSKRGYCLFLNTKNVRKDGFNFDILMFITKQKDEQLRKGKAKINDVILTTRGTIGNVAIYNENVPFNNIRINSGMVLLRTTTSILAPKFLFYLIQMPIVQQQFRQLISGSAQPQLPITNLKKIRIPYPDPSIQNKFIRIMEKTRAMKKNQLSSLKNEEQLFNSLMQKAFEGGLWVK